MVSSHDDIHWMDQYVAPGLRLWMLVGLVGSVLLVMTVIVCCFMRIRIPRTKRQIEEMAAQRKQRQLQRQGHQGSQEADRLRSHAIVMNSLPSRNPQGRGEPNRREPLNSHSVNV